MAATRINDELIPTAVNNMNTISKGMEAKMKSSCDKVRNMQNVWHGQRYNDFCTYYNKFIDAYRPIQTYTIVTVPEWMKNWDKKIAVFENRAPRGVTVETITVIEPIVPQARTGIHIDPAGVEGYRTEIINDLNAMVSACPDYERCVDILGWEGPTADNFKTTMATNRAKMEEQLKEIETVFNREIQGTLEDRARLESGGVQ